MLSRVTCWITSYRVHPNQLALEFFGADALGGCFGDGPLGLDLGKVPSTNTNYQSLTLNCIITRS